MDNTGIAQMLCIAEDTVKNHVVNIDGKLNVRSRAEAVAWAWRLDLGKSLGRE